MGIESMVFLLVVGLEMSHESLAQSAGGCTTALISLSPCLSYITGSGSSSSFTTTPSSSCCSRLASVVQSQPQCLCSALNDAAAASLGVTINQTRALALPAACNVQTPPPSRCNGNQPHPIQLALAALNLNLIKLKIANGFFFSSFEENIWSRL